MPCWRAAPGRTAQAVLAHVKAVCHAARRRAGSRRARCRRAGRGMAVTGSDTRSNTSAMAAAESSLPSTMRSGASCESCIASSKPRSRSPARPVAVDPARSASSRAPAPNSRCGTTACPAWTCGRADRQRRRRWCPVHTTAAAWLTAARRSPADGQAPRPRQRAELCSRIGFHSMVSDWVEDAGEPWRELLRPS